MRREVASIDVVGPVVVPELVAVGLSIVPTVTSISAMGDLGTRGVPPIKWSPTHYPGALRDIVGKVISET